MRTPAKTSSVRAHYLFGRYIARALDRDGQLDLLALIRVANQTMLQAERDREDAEVPVEEAICDRDFCDREIDNEARTFRVGLLSRGRNATREAPYIKILPNGISEYVQAPKGEQRTKYTLLIKRIEEFLGEGDTLRISAVPALQEKLDAWLEASAVQDAQTAKLELSRGVRDSAIVEWEKVVVTVYGQLLGRVGKEKAEFYFPRVRKARADEPAEAEPAEAEPAEAEPAEAKSGSSGQGA